MRVLKTGAAAAVVIGSLTAVQLQGSATQDQVIREREIMEPMMRAGQILSLVGDTRIGITIDDVDGDDVKTKKLSSEAGVIVASVDDDSPASKAGLRAGDVIVEFDGERVRSASQLRRMIQETPSGRSVGVVVMRDGQRTPLSVTPESGRRARTFMTTPRVHAAPHPPRPPHVLEPNIDVHIPDLNVEAPRAFTFMLGTGRLGVSTQGLSDQLAKHFGVEDGVLVSEVEEDSAAAKAGLRAGDIITKFNGQTIDDTGDLAREVVRAEGEVTIEIVRDRKAQTLKAAIERARPRSRRFVI